MKRMIIVIFSMLNVLIINGYSQSSIDQKKFSFNRYGVQNNTDRISFGTSEIKKFQSKNSISMNRSSTGNKRADISSPSAFKTIFFDPQKQWGIICRKEWEMEKSIGLPIRFRLGTLEYVNQLEGK